VQLEALLQQVHPDVLEFDEEARMLALAYLEATILPRKYVRDAQHIAIAVVSDMDVVVSWNLEHNREGQDPPGSQRD
jgi:hypothetical protein